jgi:hypothetical protein
MVSKSDSEHAPWKTRAKAGTAQDETKRRAALAHSSFGAQMRNDAERKEAEHISLRDPDESSQGPLRLDDPNYSVERLTPREGGYNEYANAEESYLDDDEAPRPGALNPQLPEDSQRDMLDTLPAGDDSVRQPEEGFENAQLQTGDHDARNDLAILDDINDVIAGLHDADAASIDITVQNGAVILDGKVGEADERSRIEQTIEAIPGVTEVRNCLTVRGEAEHPRWDPK